MIIRIPATGCLAALAAAQLVGCATPPVTQPEVEPPHTAPAFLEFLAGDAVVLQPGPVWGRAAWEVADWPARWTGRLTGPNWRAMKRSASRPGPGC